MYLPLTRVHSRMLGSGGLWKAVEPSINCFPPFGHTRNGLPPLKPRLIRKAYAEPSTCPVSSGLVTGSRSPTASVFGRNVPNECIPRRICRLSFRLRAALEVTRSAAAHTRTARLPFLGQALSVDFSRFHLQLDEWSRRYGPVIRFTLLGQDIVVLSGIDVVREALVARGTDFAGRPPAYRAERVTYGKDIVFQNFSNSLVGLRRLALKALRSYGDGMSRLEVIFTEAGTEFVDEIARKDGQPIEIDKNTYDFVCNVMATIVYGEKVAPGDPIVHLVSELNKSIQEACDPVSTGKELDVMPWLRHTFVSRKGMALVEKAERLLAEIIEQRLKVAQETLDPAHPRGCLDQFLLAQKSDSDEAGKPMWDSEHVTALCINLIAGGTKTTYTALCAIYLLLVNYPDVQKKLQNEIDAVVGRARAAMLKDTEQLPYSQAFILEVLRFIPVLPISPPRMTIVDTSVGGYTIPANTRVFINNWSVLHDPTVYPKPFDFNPERFLDDSGALLPHDHPVRTSFVAFGLGRRICIGEHFVRSRLLLLVTTLLQRYTIIKDESRPFPDADPRNFVLQLLLEVPKYSVHAVLRS